MNKKAAVQIITLAKGEYSEVDPGKISSNTQQLALVVPSTTVRVPTIGKSKLSNPAEVAQARADVTERVPQYINRYAEIGEALIDPEWQDEQLKAEFEVLTVAIQGTGSTDAGASPTARKTREVILLAAGMAMCQFPRTIKAMTYLANHATTIGLLRPPQGPSPLCVELPTGDPVRPRWKDLICPIPKSAQIITAYTAMVKEAVEARKSEQATKIALLKLGTGNFLDVAEAGEGETVCFVPGDRFKDTLPIWLQIKIEGGYITVTDAAGSFFAESLIGYWVPSESIEAGYFHKTVTEGLTQENIKAMTGLRYSIRDGLVYAMKQRDLAIAEFAAANNQKIETAASATTSPTKETPMAAVMETITADLAEAARVEKSVNPANKLRRDRRRQRRARLAQKSTTSSEVKITTAINAE